MIKDTIRKEIEQALLSVYQDKFSNISEIPDYSIESTNEKFGDYATSVAMIISKRVGETPEEIAKKITKIIEINKIFEKVEIAKPGFINFKIALPYLQNKISEIINSGQEYGKSNIGKNQKLNIEFVSANPTGPLTIGNARGGVIGDTLASVFKNSGFKVTKEYYFNDAGGQIDILGHSILKDDQTQYKGEYIDELAKEIKTQDYKEAGKIAAKILIDDIKKTVEKMGIKFDVWFAEGKNLRDKGKVEEIINWLKKEDLIYLKDEAWWFKATKFGDDKDRVVIKSSGEPTYFGLDCAYHKNKFIDRKFDRVIDIWGADHHGDTKRVKGFVKALGYEDKFDIILHQFVRVTVDGKEVRMSKRAGNFITVDDLLKEVGKDAYRFFMLSYDINSHLNFDLDLAKEQSQKNPVYYVQYAYARIHSILAKLKAQNSKLKTETDLKTLEHPAEIKLIKELIKFPEIVAGIAGDYQVQKLPTYAIELANSFHHFYEKCPIIKSDEKIKSARIELIKATQTVLKNVLDLIGVSAPEKM